MPPPPRIMPASPRPSAWLWLCALGLLLSHAARPSLAAVFTNHWAVKVTGGTTEADRIASKYGYMNLGQIGSLRDYYHFHHSRVMKRATVRSRGAHTFIEAEPQVEWVEQQVVRRRSKRDFKTVSVATLLFNDPKWSSMWYLNCSDRGYNCRSDMNVMAAWRRGYTGRNVVVTILDDGIERNHPDLVDNYDPLASYDVNGDDLDPMPRYDISNENKHGTRCAGEVAATANNSICVSGVAYNARIGGVRMLDGEVTDMVEATALSVNPQHIDVYSASWGPDDDGRTVDGPATLARRALETGIRKGRGGLGSIYVWASGNGGRSRDHCSCDGYTNSIFTISISSSTESGKKPWYLEECASTLATTYSSGEAYDRKIITTDLRQKCTDGHTGTSASAPMAAGIIALALEANPGLTWRDVQHIVVKTSRSNNLHAPDWKTNGAGHRVSHLYGFGLMDAGAMVMEAEKWRPLPPQHVCVESAERSNRLIRSSQTLTAVHQATGCADNAVQRVVFLEHVVVRVTISHPRRGDLSIYLTSPSGTKSQLLAKRAFDNSQEGFKNWEFMTSHCWGERAAGTWTLEIHDNPSNYFRNPRVLGKLKEWSLILHGTAEPPYTWQGGAGGPAGKVERDRSPEPANPTEHAATAHEAEYEDYSEETEYSGLCHAECDSQGCDGPGEDQCMSCARWSLRLRGGGRKCLSECPVGFFGDGDTRRCRRCARECRACSGAGLERCSECRTGYFRQEGPGPQCVAACSDGFYLDTAAMMCRRCTESCERCVGAAERCTMCRNGLSLHGSMCVPKCQERTYFNLQETRCEPCHPSCNTCATGGEYSCLKCAAGYLRQDGICVPDCSPSYYREEVEEGAEPSCDKCEVSCVTCSGPTDRSCTSCSEGQSLEAGACVAVYTCRDSSGETVNTSFCYLVKVNNLCSRKVLQQLCCRTCSNLG